MSILNSRERELVALGAALASNCIPCIDYHIQESRTAGLSDAEIEAAIALADKVRRVPADKVLAAATRQLAAPSGKPLAAPAAGCTAAAKGSSFC